MTVKWLQLLLSSEAKWMMLYEAWLCSHRDHFLCFLTSPGILTTHFPTIWHNVSLCLLFFCRNTLTHIVICRLCSHTEPPCAETHTFMGHSHNLVKFNHCWYQSNLGCPGYLGYGWPWAQLSLLFGSSVFNCLCINLYWEGRGCREKITKLAAYFF